MPSTPAFRSPRLIAKFTTGAFVLFAVGCVWDMSLAFEALAAFAHPERIDMDWAQGFAARADQAYKGSLAFYLLTALLFAIWTYRVAKNADCFDADDLTIGAGSAVGYYFVPIFNLWGPYKALMEVWRASSPAGHKRVPAWVPVWWATWVLSGLTAIAVIAARNPATPEALNTLLITAIAADVTKLLAGGLATAVVWRLTRIQDERWSAESPARMTVETR